MQLGNQIVREIEAEFADPELGKVIRWADAKYEDRWTNALNRLDRALGLFQTGLDHTSMTAEYEAYRATVKALMAEYKQVHQSDALSDFLKSIKTGRSA